MIVSDLKEKYRERSIVESVRYRKPSKIDEILTTSFKTGIDFVLEFMPIIYEKSNNIGGVAENVAARHKVKDVRTIIYKDIEKNNYNDLNDFIDECFNLITYAMYSKMKRKHHDYVKKLSDYGKMLTIDTISFYPRVDTKK